MSSWGNYDNAANSPYWDAATVNLTPDAANAALLFANTTANAFVTNTTIGVFGVDANEAQTDGKGAHTGWVRRTTFTGGRANRVQQEVLVAMNTINLDNENAVYPNTTLSITTQPVSNSAIRGTGNTVTFTVVATATPSATINYQWEYNTLNGSLGWTSNNFNGILTGNNTSTLTANATSNTANSYVVRVKISSPATTAVITSSNARITITP